MANEERLTWEQMKERYPNEWLAIRSVVSDEAGYLASGIVFHHGKTKETFMKRMRELEHELGIEKECTAQRYTGIMKHPFPDFQTKYLVNKMFWELSSKGKNKDQKSTPDKKKPHEAEA